MRIVACTIPSRGFVMNLIAFMAGADYYASPENRWGEVVHPHLNWKLLLHDPRAAQLSIARLPSHLLHYIGFCVLPTLSLTTKPATIDRAIV